MEDMLYFFSPAFMSVCIVLAVGLAALGAKSIKETTDHTAREALWNGTILHAIGYLLVPLVIGIVSWSGYPLFLGRYFLPSTLGAAVILGYILHSILPSCRLTSAQQVGVCVVICVLLSWPIWDGRQAAIESTYKDLDRTVAKGLPVIVEDANTFVPLTYYSRGKNNPYYYIADWDVALRSASLHATVQYKLMRNARSVGYYNGRIIDTDDALCRFPSFIVLDGPGLRWYEERIRDNPNFDSHRIAFLHTREPGPTQAWLVTKHLQSPGCQGAASTVN